MSAEFCKQYFLCSHTKNHTKLNQEIEAIEYIHISLSTFHERYYWDIPSQYDENEAAHHIFLAVTFFVEQQDQPLLKAQAIYSARKKGKFPHLSGQKSMDQIFIYNSASSV